MALPYPFVIDLGTGELNARAVQMDLEAIDQWIRDEEAWHYVGHATSGMGTSLASPVINFDGGYQRARFRKDRGRVYVEGTVYTNSMPASNIIFTLPVGYRPTAGPGGGAVLFTVAWIHGIGALAIGVDSAGSVHTGGSFASFALSFIFDFGLD